MTKELFIMIYVCVYVFMYYCMYPLMKGRELTPQTEFNRKIAIISASIALISAVLLYCCGKKIIILNDTFLLILLLVCSLSTVLAIATFVNFDG